MDRIKTKLIIAVSNRLSAAADTDAKTDLIEELSENLYQRYLDLVATGVEEEQAYSRALDALGDVEELLEYLRSLGPDGKLPKQDEGRFGVNIDDIVRGAEDIVRETISQTKDAVDQARIIVRDIAKKLKEKYPNGFSHVTEIHFDAHADGSDDATQANNTSRRDVVYGFGYDKKKGGFFTQWGNYKGSYVEGTIFPSQDIAGLDLHLINGDVSIYIDPNPNADISLGGDTEHLDIRLSEDGILNIRPEKTASASFFSLHGLTSTDVELTLPARHWESIQIVTVNGDVDLFDNLDVGDLSIKTVSGDISGQLQVSGNLRADCVSGDIELEGSFGSANINTISGDISLSGSLPSVHCSSASGDILMRLSTLPKELVLSSKSGDCTVSIPGELGFCLQFNTVSGELTTDFSLLGPMGVKRGEAVYLDGGESVLHLSSISGDIALQQL